MNLDTTIKALAAVGNTLKDAGSPAVQEAVQQAYIKNKWFTPENIQYTLNYWGNALTEGTLSQWAEKEQIPAENPAPKTVGIVAAGNIPMVGLHDILCVLMTGNKALVKLSSDDEVLMKFFIEQLVAAEPAFEDYIKTTERIENIDAAIATGSNNTARYFEYYFGKYPHIIRKNRNSIAILTGDETPETIKKIGFDITAYFGKGCRNVTQVWAPKGYNWEKFIDAILEYFPIIDHHKYANNYTYHKAILLMNMSAHLDSGFLLLQESEKIYSPIGVLNYRHYDTPGEVTAFIAENAEAIQCIVSEAGFIDNAVAPGQSQNPALWEYADGVNTIEFLKGL